MALKYHRKLHFPVRTNIIAIYSDDTMFIFCLKRVLMEGRVLVRGSLNTDVA